MKRTVLFRLIAGRSENENQQSTSGKGSVRQDSSLHGSIVKAKKLHSCLVDFVPAELHLENLAAQRGPTLKGRDVLR